MEAKPIFKLKQYTVEFRDFDDRLIVERIVEHGSNAEAPIDPERIGYNFTEWDKPLTNITSDQVVKAQYSIINYTITYEPLSRT